MMNLRSRHTALFALFLAVLLAGTGVWAQKFLESYKAPMPKITLAPEAQFEAATNLYQDVPFGDKALAFQIRVPKGWQTQKDAGHAKGDSVGNKLLGELARFYGPPNLDQRSYMTVQALKLQYQLTAEQWFIQWLLANAYTLQGIKTIDDKRVEAIYVYVDRDTTYAVRAVIQINGKRAIMAQYFLPTDQWDAEKQMQAQSIGSFKIQNIVDEFIEPMEQYHFLDISDFSYPTSWQVQSDSLKSIDRLQVDLLSVASEKTILKKKYKLLNGKISISVVADSAISSLPEEIQDFKKQITKGGLVVKEFIETKDDFVMNEDMDSRPVEVYKVIDTANNVLTYELWFLIMESGDYYYFVTLLTPSRDEDYFMWSRNTQTFRLLVKTIEPQTGSLIKD